MNHGNYSFKQLGTVSFRKVAQTGVYLCEWGVLSDVYL